MRKRLVILPFGLCLLGMSFVSVAQENVDSYIPKVGGTFRTKLEYQTDEGNARFQVRDARVNVNGWITPYLDYKLELNLSDKGKIRTHDLFARFHVGDFRVQAGQFRVPISVDAARSPHIRYFANRSFIGKQVGNVFDVGVKGSYAPKKFPLLAEFGIYDGMGSSPDDKTWRKDFLYVGKLNYKVAGFNLTAAAMTNKPENVRVNIYESCLGYTIDRFFVEGEYVYKHYENDILDATHAYNIMAGYGLPIENKIINKISFLGRFDAMSDNSDALTYEEGLKVTDVARKRLTFGTTFAYLKKVRAELRLNYEKYFYDKDVTIGVSDHDKIVAEIMINF